MGDLISNGTAVARLSSFSPVSGTFERRKCEFERRRAQSYITWCRIYEFFYCIHAQRTHDSIGACVFNERYLGRVYRAAATPSRPHDTPSQKFTSIGTRCRILPNIIVTVFCARFVPSFISQHNGNVSISILREQSVVHPMQHRTLL